MTHGLDGLWPSTDPVRPGVKDAAPGALDRAAEERILDAADRLVRQIGIGRVSMAEVARGAKVARGTLYRYFESREVLLDALSQRAADRFFTDVAAAMDGLLLLSEQLGEFSKRIIQSIHPESEEPSGNRIALVRLLATQSVQALRRTARFLRPYIAAARERGEVRADLDLDDAGEWLARILLSFTIFQASISHEAGDPLAVGLFVRRYAISGLT
ncbi:helix-turn-helix domain-containing protein [Actinocorallia libanotica]|uniref:TetR/AcrR family transcriptional regulator n=1 Tax=Actinocorallia libanotica TaxID=46162 RepID=A0ABN1RMI5_9ACTN